MYSPFVYAYLETRIISVEEIFTELWIVFSILCWASPANSPFAALKFCTHALILNSSALWNISDHNQTLFFLYFSVVNVNLETRIISVGEIFRELWIVLNILCWTCVIHSPFSAHKFCKQALKRSLKYFGPQPNIIFFLYSPFVNVYFIRE